LEGSVRVVAICPNASVCQSAFINDVRRKVVLEPYLVSFRVTPGLRTTAV
jgi:hypothetical protein